MIKCRTNILLSRKIESKFPCYSVLDQPCLFDAEDELYTSFPAGKYWIKVQKGHQYLVKGNGWYTHDQAKYAVETKSIDIKQIKYILKASITRPGNYYAKFVQSVLDKLIISNEGSNDRAQEIFVAKGCINQWVGTLGIRTSEFKKIDIYSSLEAAASENTKYTDGSSSSAKTELRKKLNGNYNGDVLLFPKVFDTNDSK